MSKGETNYHFFQITDAELNRQVEEHDNLPVTKSTRGVAALTMLGLLVLGLAIIFAFELFNVTAVSFTVEEVVLSLIVYLPLVYFTYRGSVIAIVLLAIWYTLDKLLTPIALGFGPNASSVAFWLIGIAPLWVAFRVERAYQKKKKALNVENVIKK